MKHVLAGASALVLALLAGCATTQTPATVANDVALEAQSLSAVIPQLTAAGVVVPVKATDALADLHNVAALIAATDSVGAAQPLVIRVEQDVNAFVGAMAGMPLPPPIPTVLQAAVVLLPIIESEVNLVVPAKAAPSGMSPAQARLVLAGAR